MWHLVLHFATSYPVICLARSITGKLYVSLSQSAVTLAELCVIFMSQTCKKKKKVTALCGITVAVL